MKLTIVLLTAGFLNVSATGVSQNITFSGKNVSLETVFSSIEKQSGVVFLYTGPVLKASRPVTISAIDSPLADFLKELFKTQPLKYSIDGKSILVFPKVVGSSDLQQKNGTFNILKDTLIDVRGRVVNENGEPMAGANVIIKGTTKGVTTNSEGYFELTGVDSDAILIISAANIETKELPLDGKDNLNIVSVKTKITSLQEVVVSKGYYSEKKILTTGSVSKVSAAEIEKQPVTNVLAALTGRVPGLVISQTNGLPGSFMNVQIRGRNSLRDEANYPLILIDGVPFLSSPLNAASAGGAQGNVSPLNFVNPNDIESIEILKDADATAIYGSRGANGVMLITTKKGKAGKIKTNINFYTGAGRITRKMDLLNTRQYLDMRYEALKNDGLELSPALFNVDDLIYWDTTRYTDWQKELIGGTSTITNAQFTISGGQNNVTYNFGGGYVRETTVYPGNFADQKGFGKFSISTTSNNQKLQTTVSASYLAGKNNLLSSDLTQLALFLPPNAPTAYDSVGKLNWENNTWFNNPYAELKKEYTATTGNLISNMSLSYSILKNLAVRANLGYTNTTFDGVQIIPLESIFPLYRTTGSSSFAENKNRTWIVEPQIDYSLTIGGGQLSALVGATMQETKRMGYRIRASGYSNNASLRNIAAAPERSYETIYSLLYKYIAAYGRLNYNYRDKYIINLTGRRDGSSRFGPGKQFADFGAVGLAWIFSNEKFIRANSSVLSVGKIKASYGSTGSDEIGDYQYLTLYNASQRPYQGSQSVYPSNLANLDYAWETNKKLEVGLELGFLNDKISIGANYYKNRSSNQLVGFPLPATTGFNSILFNFPAAVQNTGLELALNTRNVSSQDFSWTSSFNLTVPENKLVAYPGIENSAYRFQYIVGEPLSVVQGYHFIGVDPATGIYQFGKNKSNEATNSPLFPEDLISKLQDVVSFYGGLGNNFNYKGFQLDLFFQFVKQNGRVDFAQVFNTPGMMSNQPALVLNRWQEPGDITSVQKFTQAFDVVNNAYSSVVQSDKTIGDASFIRLKNLSFGYKFPSKLLDQIKLQDCKIFLQGQNLLTVTNFEGFDPENKSLGSLPPLKVITVGVQLTF